MSSPGHESRHDRYTQTHPPSGGNGDSVHQPTFKIFCKANEGYCLAIRGDTLILAPADSRDEHQHWFKDTRLSIAFQDEEGNPVFSLVNKATGLAIKHSLGPYHPVRLVKSSPDVFDESILWTESGDLGKDFGCIRMIHDISLGLDILGGGVSDSITVVLSEWAKSDTQSWKILFWDDEANATCSGLYTMPTCRIYCKATRGFSVTIRSGHICLAPTDHADEYQHWIEDSRYRNRIKDEEGNPAFALINRVTGEAIKCSGKGHPVKLVPYNPNYLDKSVLWTKSCVEKSGYCCIHAVHNILHNFHASRDDRDLGINIVLSHWCESDDQRWKIVSWCMSHNPTV